jgi:hypothetical protein
LLENVGIREAMAQPDATSENARMIANDSIRAAIDSEKLAMTAFDSLKINQRKSKRSLF